MPDSSDPIFKSKWDRGVFSPLSVSVALHAVVIIGLSGFIGNWGAQALMAEPEPEILVELVMAEYPVQEEQRVDDVLPEPSSLPPLPDKAEEVREEKIIKPQEMVKPVPEQVRQDASQVRGVGDVQSYTAHIVSRINAHKFYPSHARQKHEEGDVILSFRVSRSGDVASVRIIQSSFSHALDSAAIQAVKTAAPFDPPPAYLPDRALLFKLPVRYRLREK